MRAIEMRTGDRLFVQVFYEVTRFRFTEGGSATRHAHVVTEALMCKGVMILIVEAQIDEEDAFANAEDSPAGLVCMKGLQPSAAIRLAVKSHDRALEMLRARMPEDAERAP